jgi:hypothetical protein
MNFRGAAVGQPEHSLEIHMGQQEIVLFYIGWKNCCQEAVISFEMSQIRISSPVKYSLFIRLT